MHEPLSLTIMSHHHSTEQLCPLARHFTHIVLEKFNKTCIILKGTVSVRQIFEVGATYILIGN